MWDQLQKIILNYSPRDKELIRTAYDLALSSHGNQKRDSGDPYISHPVAVATELIKLKLDSSAIAAALLHDVLEDTPLTKAELRDAVGDEVSFLVEGLTKLDRVKYRGFERTVESTRKMFLAVAEDVRVVLIKLSDRLHNMRTIKWVRPEKQTRIATETLEIFAPLAYRLGMGELKGELEDLSFPIVYPEEYAWVYKETKERLSERNAYLERVRPFVEEELKKGGLKTASIDFRAKNYYSIWKKLLRNDLDMSRVTDLTAMRITVHTIEECYQALGIIHGLWKPMPGRIKDYISLPKPNGYRSLHTTVFCLDDKTTEFQIRTHEMHEEAEFGVAAHWVWEAAGKPKEGTRANVDKIAWVKRLQEWQRDFTEESGEDFMESLKIEFFKDRIFVLTPKGEVIDLPEGSTPVDFAFHVHSAIGSHMTGAKVNNKMVPFSYILSSGDSIEILTQKNQKPSIDWLDFARSSATRGHIRSALRKTGIEPPAIKEIQEKKKTTTLLIVRENRIGLLKDITSQLARDRLNITKTESDTADVNKPYLLIQFEAQKHLDLDRLLTRLKKIKGVKEVTVKKND
ncbi:MAG: RelA/SpoT family protein [Patescibacteria group bacterium]